MMWNGIIRSLAQMSKTGDIACVSDRGNLWYHRKQHLSPLK